MASKIEKAKLYGKKIYLLGTAELGPVNTPIRALSTSHVHSVFGTQGSLVDAYKVIRETKNNCEVYLVKVTGTHSELYLNINQSHGEIIKDGFYIKSKHANEKYNNIKIMIDSEALYIIYDNYEVGNYTLEYKYSDYITLQELAEAINEDSRRLRSEVYCYANCEPHTLSAGALEGVNPSFLKLTGGNSGLFYNKNMLYNCLSETYSILEGVDIDLILPLTANYDDTFTSKQDDIDMYYDLSREYLTLKDNKKYLSFYNQLLQFCINQMRFSYLTHGVMGFSSTNDPFINEEDYLDTIRHFKKVNEVRPEYKKYKQLISVCVGDLYTTYGTRIYNGYLAYSTVIASISITENTTNKLMPETMTLYNNFDNNTLSEFAKLGFTSFRYSPLKRNVVVSNGVTTSDDDRFKYLCNIRMAQLAMGSVRNLLQKFIGKNIINLVKTKELEQSLIDLLEDLSVKGVIKGFSINEVVNPVTGHIFLDLSFKTLYMLEDIKAYSGIAAIK